MKLKLCSSKKISHYYEAVQKLLVNESVMHSARLDFLEHAVTEHRSMLDEVKDQRADSFSMTEATIKDLKNAHSLFVENKRAREASIANTRREAEKANVGLKGCLKVTLARHADLNDPHKDSIVPPQVSASKMEMEEERSRRLEAENQVSHLRRICKVAAKEDVLPALKMQTNVQASLQHQIDVLEKERACLQHRRDQCMKEYKLLKYYGDRDLSEALGKLQQEKSAITKHEESLSREVAEAIKSKTLLSDIEKAVSNLHHILHIQTDGHDENNVTLVERMKACHDNLKNACAPQGEDHSVELFKDSTELGDHLLEILPGGNRRVTRRKEEEDDQYVFDDDGTKNVISVPSRRTIKLQSQQIADKHAGRGGRPKAKARKM